MNYVSSGKLVFPDAKHVDLLAEHGTFVVHVIYVDHHQR